MIKIEPLNSLGINTIHQIQKEAFQSYRQFFSIFPPLWETLDDLKDYLPGNTSAIIGNDNLLPQSGVYSTRVNLPLFSRLPIYRS